MQDNIGRYLLQAEVPPLTTFSWRSSDDLAAMARSCRQPSANVCVLFAAECCSPGLLLLLALVVEQLMLQMDNSLSG